MSQHKTPTHITTGSYPISQPKKIGEYPLSSDPTIEFFNSLVAKDSHQLLGKTGVKVSRVSLGSMNFGEIDSKYGERPGQMTESKAYQVLDKFIQLGGNSIDTANFYPWFGSTVGQSETIIGKWLKKQNREKLFLITKFHSPTDPKNVNSGGFSRSNIIDQVNQSLTRLNTDYVDLLILNGWDENVEVEDLVKSLNDLIKCGKIRYYGVSDVKGWQLQKLIDTADYLNVYKCVCYMGEYNLLTRRCEDEITEVCKNENIAFLGYSPFKYGILTDDFCKNLEKPMEGSRVESASKKRPNLAAMAVPFEEIQENPIFKSLVQVLKTIASARKYSIETVSLLWALQTGHVTSVVVGVEDLEELTECMECLKKEIFLSFDEMRQLNEVSLIRSEYPYNMNLSSIAGFELIPKELLKNSTFQQMSLQTWHEILKNQPTTKNI